MVRGLGGGNLKSPVVVCVCVTCVCVCVCSSLMMWDVAVIHQTTILICMYLFFRSAFQYF